MLLFLLVPLPARAQPPPDAPGGGVIPSSGDIFGEPPEAHALTNALGQALTTSARLARMQRYESPPPLPWPGQTTVPSVFPGPDMRIAIPATEPTSTPRLGPFSFTLIPIEVANPVVADARGPQGVLVGIRVPVPWMLP
jgi:hypothetical protein